jgi:response regulator RpfG family c-di-GMP phosphodiesterase
MMLKRILCVDDEPNILMAYKRQFRKHFEIDTAQDGEKALRLVDDRGPYAVVVADMRMPGMNGIELLKRVKAKAPDTVRMMLTGNSDQQTAIDAINDGHIFRFLSKPCLPKILAQALIAGLEQYRLITAERELLEKTLKSIVHVLTDVLSLVNPEAFGRTTRLKRHMRDLAHAMGLPQVWSLETAALLSQIGAVLLPQGVLHKVCSNSPLSEEERQLVDMQPSVASNLIAKIPRMEEMVEIIQYQEKNFDGSGSPIDDVRGDKIPMGARLLKAVLDFDTWESSGMSPDQSLARMEKNAYRYDPQVFMALNRIKSVGTPSEVRDVKATQLTDGMVLAEDAKTKTGLLVVARGQETSISVREFLMNFHRSGMLVEPLRVVIESNVDKAHRMQDLQSAGCVK